jgi:hypothetical protein
MQTIPSPTKDKTRNPAIEWNKKTALQKGGFEQTTKKYSYNSCQLTG